MFWPARASITDFIYGSRVSKTLITYFWLYLKISYVRYPTTEIHSIHLFYPPNWISCIFYDVIYWVFLHVDWDPQ